MTSLSSQQQEKSKSKLFNYIRLITILYLLIGILYAIVILLLAQIISIFPDFFSLKQTKEHKAEVSSVNDDYNSSQLLLPSQKDDLILFIKKAFQFCNTNNISEFKLKLLENYILTVANSYFTTQEHKEAFILLLCIESKFNNTVKSSAGAIGIAQVMPKFAKEFLSECGITETLMEHEVSDFFVNIHIGACRFKTLLEKHNNISLALAAYNSGAYSQSVKKLKTIQTGHPETMAYLAKFSYLRDELKN